VIDAEAEPAKRADLDRPGIPLIPAVVVDDRAVHGWSPKALAKPVGVPYREAGRLGSAEFVDRLHTRF
jgi:hypothetical protein